VDIVYSVADNDALRIGYRLKSGKRGLACKAGRVDQPFGAGGAADVQARKLAEIISKDLGQPLVVRNVTGAGGAIAYNEVHRAKPDAIP